MCIHEHIQFFALIDIQQYPSRVFVFSLIHFRDMEDDENGAGTLKQKPDISGRNAMYIRVNFA
jgi:hypothetical protein